MGEAAAIQQCARRPSLMNILLHLPGQKGGKKRKRRKREKKRKRGREGEGGEGVFHSEVVSLHFFIALHSPTFELNPEGGRGRGKKEGGRGGGGSAYASLHAAS